MRTSIVKLLSSIGRERRRLRRRRAIVGARLAGRSTLPSGLDYLKVFDHLDAELEAVANALRCAEATHDLNLARVEERREARDRAATALRDLHAPVPNLLRHLNVPMPRSRAAESPEAVGREAARTVCVLRRLERDPPAPVGGISLDPGPLAEQLESHGRHVEDAIVGLGMAESAVKSGHSMADQKFAVAGRVLSWVARTLESLDGLAGAG